MQRIMMSNLIRVLHISSRFFSYGVFLSEYVNPGAFFKGLQRELSFGRMRVQNKTKNNEILQSKFMDHEENRKCTKFYEISSARSLKPFMRKKMSSVVLKMRQQCDAHLYEDLKAEV